MKTSNTPPSVARATRRAEVLQLLPGDDGGAQLHVYTRLLSTRGDDEKEGVYRSVPRGRGEQAWTRVRAKLDAEVNARQVFDETARASAGVVLLSIPLGIVTHSVRNKEHAWGEGSVSDQSPHGRTIDDAASLLWPDKVLADEQYMLAALRHLALRCDWQEEHEDLDTWLARELKAGEQTEATDG
jgi:hypothetical protein